MTFCIDCKHMGKNSLFNTDDDDCTHIQAQSTSLVTGAVVYESCNAMRGDDAACGPSAKLFEQEDERPWWRKIFNS